MADLAFIRRKLELENAVRSLENLPHHSDAYYAVYFEKIFPTVLEIVQASLAESMRRAAVPGYGTLVMPLSLNPEPHVLMAAAVRPAERLVLLVTPEAERVVLPWLQPYLGSHLQQESVNIEHFTLSDYGRLLDRVCRHEAERVLVDITGYKKSCAVNLALAAERRKGVDLVYLDAGAMGTYLNTTNVPRPGTERILLWTAAHRRRQQEIVVQLQNTATCRISEDGTGFRFAFQHSARYQERVLRPFPFELVQPVLDILATGRRPEPDVLQQAGSVFYDHCFPLALKQALHNLRHLGKIDLILSQQSARLPWDLAWHQGTFLAERFLITRHISIATPQQPCRKPALLLVENPTADSLLNGAAREASLIRDSIQHANQKRAQQDLPPITLTHLATRQATRGKLLLELKRHGLFHFIGHSGPEGLQLADGTLRVTDLRKCSGLPAFTFCNSCRSADPDLAHTFLQGGCTSYLGARWLLEEVTATSVVQEFYQRLFHRWNLLDALEGMCGVENNSASLAYTLYGDVLVELEV